MGDLVPVDFRDRRRLPEQLAAVEPVEFSNKSALHDHLRTMHGYGGPKSQTRAHLDHVHDNRHASSPEMGKAHSHL